MPNCITLYKMNMDNRDVVLAPYIGDSIVAIRGGVGEIVRQIEATWTMESALSDSAFIAVMTNYTTMNPSVIAVGEDVVASMIDAGILTDPYKIVDVAFLGQKKFMAALCEGTKADFYWRKGKKPQPPKERTSDSSFTQIQAEGAVAASGGGDQVAAREQSDHGRTVDPAPVSPEGQAGGSQPASHDLQDHPADGQTGGSS